MAQPSQGKAKKTKTKVKKPRSKKIKEARGINGFTPLGRGHKAQMDPVKQFALAMRNVFDPRAEGVRVPDLYSFPVETGHLHGRFTCNANASAKISAAFMANPVLSMVDLNAMTGSSSCLSVTSMTPYNGGNTFLYGATTPASLDTKFNAARVVAAGIKIRVAQAEGVRTGVVIFAPFACVGDIPGYVLLNNSTIVGADAASGAIIGGGNPSSVSSPALLGMPGAFMMSLADLGSKDVNLPFRILNEIGHQFTNTNQATTYNATTNYGTSVAITNTTGAVVYEDLENLTSSEGWSGWFVYCDQFNDTTATDAILSGEYYYHLEGTPATAPATAIGTLINDSPPPPVVNVSAYREILDFAAQLPWADIIPADRKSVV